MGTVDVGPVWATEVIHARQSNLPVDVVEPGEDLDQRDRIAYYICRLRNGAHPENAEKFLDFIKSARAQGAYKAHGFMPHFGTAEGRIGIEMRRAQSLARQERRISWDQLAKEYPMYAKTKDAVEAAGSPVLFDLGKDARTYIANMKTTIKHMVIDDLQCYCDIKAGPPWTTKRPRPFAQWYAVTVNGTASGQTWATTLFAVVSAAYINLLESVDI